MIENRVVEILRSVRFDTLTPHPHNPKRHPASQKKLMAATLDDLGFAGVVEAYRNDAGDLVLLDGHLRQLIAPDLLVDVAVMDFSESEAAQYLITRDPIGWQAQRDLESLGTLLEEVNTANETLLEFIRGEGSLVNEYVQRIAGEGGDDFDVAPDEQGVPRSEQGQLWLLGDHRLLVGDSTNADDIARLVGSRLVDMLWTDPPYGIAIGDKNKLLDRLDRGNVRSNRVRDNLINDTLDEESLFVMLRSVFGNAAAVCRDGGSWYVAAPAGPLHLVFGKALNELGIWRQTIQWVKNNATFSPLGTDYHWQAEPIFYGWKKGAAHRFYGGRTQTTVWEIARPVASPDHPTMKPIELVARAIENSSLPSEVVLDPFLGSGTTLIAAERTRRVCVGVEIEPRYADVIIRRWEAETGKVAQIEQY